MTNYNKVNKKSIETVGTVEETQPIENEIVEEVAETPKSSDGSKTGITTTYLNVRSAMSMDSDIVEVLPYKTEINILGSEDKWLQITHNDKFGYVLSEFVEQEN